MQSEGFGKVPRRARAAFLVLVMIFVAPLVSACATSPEAAKSTKFDSASDKAIIVLSARIDWYAGYAGVGETLVTHWHQYDPTTLRLVEDGAAFWTEGWDPVRAEHADYRTTMKVMEVDPGDYALIAAGTRQLKSVFVRLKDGGKKATATSYFIEPRRFIDPEAPVSFNKNFLFSVEAGQVVYIGHFEFVMPYRYLYNITEINYFQNLAAAQEALADFPGISEPVIPLNLGIQTETAARPSAPPLAFPKW